MKITDSPAAMLVMPDRATAEAGKPELSSIFQPVMSMAKAEVLVTSNQSAPTGLSPLDQGATSEMNSLPPVVPGEPISALSFAAATAPCKPSVLNAVMVVLVEPVELSKVGKGPAGAVSNATLACSAPLPLKRLT